MNPGASGDSEGTRCCTWVVCASSPVRVRLSLVQDQEHSLAAGFILTSLGWQTTAQCLWPKGCGLPLLSRPRTVAAVSHYPGYFRKLLNLAESSLSPGGGSSASVWASSRHFSLTLDLKLSWALGKMSHVFMLRGQSCPARVRCVRKDRQ